MVQRVELKLTDDLDGTDIATGRGETIEIAVDGMTYEIDLTSRNAAALRKVLVAGRRVKNSRGVHVKRIQVSADTRTVKEWARANGFEVNDRGRIPARIREAFDAAN
jgi:hypothetical protein